MRIDIKTIIIILLTVVVIVLSTCKSCVQKKYDKLKVECGEKKTNTIIKHDTVIIHEQAQFVDHAPIPYQTDFSGVIIKRVFDTLYLELAGRVDTVFVDTLVNKYYTTNYYSKKYNHRYGTITTFDTVSVNNLTGSSIKLDLSIPSVTTTQTVYQSAKKKGVLYLGLEAFGYNNIQGAGASIMYQSARALNYEAGLFFDSTGKLGKRISVKFPLTKK